MRGRLCRTVRLCARTFAHKPHTITIALAPRAFLLIAGQQLGNGDDGFG